MVCVTEGATRRTSCSQVRRTLIECREFIFAKPAIKQEIEPKRVNEIVRNCKRERRIIGADDAHNFQRSAQIKRRLERLRHGGSDPDERRVHRLVALLLHISFSITVVGQEVEPRKVTNRYMQESVLLRDAIPSQMGGGGGGVKVWMWQQLSRAK